MEQKSNSFKALSDALDRLEEGLAFDDSNDLKSDAVIQRFEFSIELFWKVLKKILAAQEIEVFTPREVMQKAYQARLIDDENVWIAMLKDRNATLHVYSENDAYEIFKRIEREYANVMKNTYLKLKDELVRRNIIFE